MGKSWGYLISNGSLFRPFLTTCMNKERGLPMAMWSKQSLEFIETLICGEFQEAYQVVSVMHLPLILIGIRKLFSEFKLYICVKVLKRSLQIFYVYFGSALISISAL